MPTPLDEIDDLIKKGQVAEARARLESRLRRPAREARLPLAALARRVGWNERGVRLLHPIVRPSARDGRRATAEEKAEYAACLTRIGALREARALLDGLAETPRTLLFRCAWHVARWEYDEAISLYRRYLRNADVGRYEKLVARVNLAAALVFTRKRVPTEPLLRDLLQDTSLAGAHFLYGSVLGLAAQHCILGGDPGRARAILARAEGRLADGATFEGFIIEKWKAIAALAADPRARAVLSPIRLRASAMGHRETLRDCDRWEGQLARDGRLLDHVWAGSPWSPYRRQIEHECAAFWRPPAEYGWRLGDGAAPVTIVLRDPVARTLTRDFYGGASESQLFGLLHEGSRYDPQSSPARVRQAIARARRLLRAEAPALDIAHAHGEYLLTARAPVTIVIGGDADDAAATLRRKFGTESFTAADAVSALGTPRRSVQRALSDAADAGKLARTGRGRAVRYRAV